MKLDFKGLEMQNERYQRIELKELVRKMEPLILLSSLLPQLWSLKCQKWLIFCIFCR